MSCLPPNYKLNSQYLAIAALLSLMDGNSLGNIETQEETTRTFIMKRLNTLGDEDSLDSFSSNMRDEPVAGPMGRNQIRSSRNRFDPMRSNRVVHVSNGQVIHVHNGHVACENKLIAKSKRDSSGFSIDMETPKSESDDRSNQSMKRRDSNKTNCKKLNRSRKKLIFEEEDSN